MTKPVDRWDQGYYGNMTEQDDGKFVLYRDYESLRQQLKSSEKELEHQRMRLAACGVVALANTRESAAKQREMLPEYWSASCADICAAIDREMDLREQLEAAKQDKFNARESLAASMITHGFATGHGDTAEDLLAEFISQVMEIKHELEATQTKLHRQAKAYVQQGAQLEAAQQRVAEMSELLSAVTRDSNGDVYCEPVRNSYWFAARDTMLQQAAQEKV